MGYDTKNQLALSIKCIVTMLDMIKTQALEMDEIYAMRLYKAGAFITILTAASLHGYEGFYLDLAATRNHIDIKGSRRHDSERVQTKPHHHRGRCSKSTASMYLLVGQVQGRNRREVSFHYPA